MKKVLFMMAIAFMGAMSFSLSACSDDDSEEEPTTMIPMPENKAKRIILKMIMAKEMKEMKAR